MRWGYIYALYKGDEFIDMGTKKELAKKRGCSPDTIGFLASPSNFKRIKKKGLLCIRVGTTKDDLKED
jgi:hypothetical protein